MRRQQRAREEPSSTALDITNAAHELFRSYNYHDVTMEQIRQKARVSKASLYFYFANKEDLFLEVGRQARQRLYEDMVATMPRQSPYAMIVNGNAVFLRSMLREGRVLSEFQILGLSEPRIAAAWNESFVPFQRDMEAWVHRRISSGEAPPQDTKLAALQFFTMIQFTTVRYFRGGNALSLSNVSIGQLLKSLSQGWYRMVFAQVEPEDFDYEPYIQLVMSAADRSEDGYFASAFEFDT